MGQNFGRHAAPDGSSNSHLRIEVMPPGVFTMYLYKLRKPIHLQCFTYTRYALCMRITVTIFTMLMSAQSSSDARCAYRMHDNNNIILYHTYTTGRPIVDMSTATASAIMSPHEAHDRSDEYMV